MPLREIERLRCTKALEGFLTRYRPPAHLRDQLDIAYRISSQSVEIFEIRPQYLDPTTRYEKAIAKATFVRTHGHWKVFWMRADLKWHAYEPDPVVPGIEAFLEIVERDELCCFFG